MSVIQSGRVGPSPMVTHRFELDHIEKAYELSVHQRDGVLKVAIALIKRCSRMRLRDRCFVKAPSIKQGDRP